jgi:hypothetical protein
MRREPEKVSERERDEVDQRAETLSIAALTVQF